MNTKVQSTWNPPKPYPYTSTGLDLSIHPSPMTHNHDFSGTGEQFHMTVRALLFATKDDAPWIRCSFCDRPRPPCASRAYGGICLLIRTERCYLRRPCSKGSIDCRGHVVRILPTAHSRSWKRAARFSARAFIFKSPSPSQASRHFSHLSNLFLAAPPFKLYLSSTPVYAV